MADSKSRSAPDVVVSNYGASASLPGFSGMQEHWTPTSSGSHLHYYTNAPGVGPADGPVLVLAHGYPQTSYIFRYLVPALQRRIRLFVPDQPGAAHSTAARSGDKKTLGSAYVEALTVRFGRGVRVVLGGHDRGARILQRVATHHRSEYGLGTDSEIEVLGAVLMDIVPIAAQFESFGQHAVNAARYFHWSLLPVTDLAVDMIEAYGAEKFCRVVHERTRGSAEQAIKSLEADHGVDVSAGWYARRDTNEAAAEDYRAAANEDFEEMVKDQKEGRKIEVPLLVLYGAGLAAMHDVPEVWKTYVKEGTRLEVMQAEKGYGHYLSEECPEWTVQRIEAFLDSLGV